jgi:YVTN family beta-propeller protein
VATVNVGVSPSGSAITSDSKYMYVANGNNLLAPGNLTGPYTVSVIDASTNLVTTTITDASFNQPYTVTINPAGTIAYVANSAGRTISKIDIKTNTVIGTISGFAGPAGIAINSAGTIGYVNNYDDQLTNTSGLGNTISVVDLTNDTITATITITSALPVTNAAPAALALTPDGKYLYVANYNTILSGGSQSAGQGTVTVISTATNTIVDTITNANFLGLFAIKIDSNGKYAYVTNFGSNNFAPFGTTVNVIRLSDNSVVDAVTLGIQPAGLAIAPGNRYAYVTNYNSLYNLYGVPPSFADNLYILQPGEGTVNIIDLATNAVVSPTIKVGQSPGNISISPNGQFAYVSNYSSNTVTVIALQSFQISASGCKMKNRYLTQIDYINKITWSATGPSLPVTYLIYRDAGLTDLAGTVAASETLVFFDHNRNPNINDTYYIVGINKVGTVSVPVSVTVSQNC